MPAILTRWRAGGAQIWRAAGRTLHRQAPMVDRRQSDVPAQAIVTVEDWWCLAFAATPGALAPFRIRRCGVRHAEGAGRRHMTDDGQKELIETRHDLLPSSFAHAKPVADGWQLRRRVLWPESKERATPPPAKCAVGTTSGLSSEKD